MFGINTFYLYICNLLTINLKSMKYFIPTYEQAINITKVNNILDFFTTSRDVNGYRVDMFNYKLAFYKEFYEIPQSIGLKHAKELRGLTFVFNENIKPNVEYDIKMLSNNIYKRFIMLEKFWNINYCPETQYDIVKHKKIKNIYEKLDGSLITFIELPNKDILAKTKGGFDNEESIMSNELLKEDKVKYDFVSYCINNNIAPTFELTTFRRGVLKYDKNELTLLKLRNNETGKYIDIYSDFVVERIKRPISYNYTLEELLELQKTQKNVEGYVVQFEDDTQLKCKTQWYFERHKIYSESIYRENDLIKMIVDNKIDDVLEQIGNDENHSAINLINEIQAKIIKWFEVSTNEVLILYKTFEEIQRLFPNDKEEVFKLFAIRHRKDKWFSVVLYVTRKIKDETLNEMIYTELKTFILKETYHLKRAEQFLKKIKI